MASPLIGYAFLKVNFDQKVGNLVDLTLPLARRALYKWPEKTIKFELLQVRIEELWGISIPQNVIRYLLPKLQNQGAIAYDNQLKLYKPLSTQTRAAEILEREREARTIYNRVIGKIRAELLRQRGINLDAREVLERFLDSGAYLFVPGTPLPSQPDKLDDAATRIIAKVIGVFSNNIDDSVLSDIQDLVVGDLLYKAICTVSEADYSDPLNARMQDVDVFLDTGVLFRCLGYFGSTFEQPALEMLQICRATGCRIRAFAHNIDEVSEGLLAVARRLYTGGAYGPIVSYVAESGVSRSDLIEESQIIQRRVEELGIEICEPPPITLSNKDLSIDERYLDWQIETDVKQANEMARMRDVDSLAAIYRIRNGEPQAILERSKAIFITSNKSLAAASVRYFQRLFREEGQRNIVQLCMTDVVLTTRLWLKVPTEFRDVPRSQILAHAISNLRPTPEVLERFLTLIRKRVSENKISAEQAASLRFSNLVRGILVVDTDNDPNLVTDDFLDAAIATGLREIQDRLRRTRDAAHETATRRVEAELLSELSRLKEKLTSLESESEQDKRAIVEANSRIEGMQLDIEASSAARNLSPVLALYIVRVLSAFTFPILLAGVVAPILVVIFPTLGAWWTVQMWAACVGVFLSILTIYGASNFDVLSNMRNRLQEHIDRGIRHLIRKPQKRETPSFRN